MHTQRATALRHSPYTTAPTQAQLEADEMLRDLVEHVSRQG